jgi:hypothetical protein
MPLCQITGRAHLAAIPPTKQPIGDRVSQNSMYRISSLIDTSSRASQVRPAKAIVRKICPERVITPEAALSGAGGSYGEAAMSAVRVATIMMRLPVAIAQQPRMYVRFMRVS